MAMNKGLLSLWLEVVHDKALPVNIHTGKTFSDCNGDRMVDVIMEYDPDDKYLIDRALEDVTDLWAGVL